ncbi:MAG TPA: carboxypeptidase-like regulatory domain-containing protein [Puia sp.]|jgi:hypothetical protein|nr:carboxypeptidase-like regulatory domain-containing protein [Puia sp.]
MPAIRTPSIFWIIIICFLFSCSKENVVGPAGPQGSTGPNGGSTISGTVFGKVELYDSLGNALSDNSGATILFVNTFPQISVVSSADGSFTSPVISAGIYDLSISKAGFGTMKMLHFQHTGGLNPTQAGLIPLGAKQSSWFDIKNLDVQTVMYSGFHYMYFTITLLHPQTIPVPQVVVYFSHAPGAGNASNDYTYRTNFYQQDDTTLVFSPFDVDLTQFTDKFNNTNDVYIAAALDNPKIFTYTDSLGNKVYPSTGNLSNEVKVFNNLKN